MTNNNHKFILVVGCRDLIFGGDDGSSSSSAKVSIIRSESGEEDIIGITERYDTRKNNTMMLLVVFCTHDN